MAKKWAVMGMVVLLGCEGDGKMSPPGEAVVQQKPRSGLQASEVVDTKNDSFDLRRSAVTIAPRTTSTNTTFTLVSSLKAEAQP